MLGDDELRKIFDEVTAECGCTIKGFRAIVAAGLRQAAQHTDGSANTLESIARDYDALNDQPPVPWEDWHAQRAQEDAAAAVGSFGREMVVEGRLVQIDDAPAAPDFAARLPKEAV